MIGRAYKWVVFFLAILVLTPGVAEAKSFLWKVSSNNGLAYVMGSIHFGRPDFFPMPTAIEQAFSESPVLAVEADITSPESIKMQVELFNQGLLPAGDDIRNHLSDRTKEAIEKLNVDMTMMTRFKPWLAAMTLQVAEYKKMGLQEEYGVDFHFLKRAKNTKEIKEVEGVDFQNHLFKNMNFEEQDMMMYYTLLYLPEMEEKMNATIDAWKSGDAATMEHLLFSDVAKHAEVAPIIQTLFSDRNKSMAGKVEEYLKTGQTHFVIVGAGHLVGPEGVIERLKEKGYNVEQL